MQNKLNQPLPASLKQYFWDVNFTTLKTQSHAFLITKRLLDRGTLPDIRWLITTYGIDIIKKVVLETKDLSAPTANLWADILELDKKKIPCLQKPYSPIHFGLSS